jgi:hypothetical protein
MTALMPRVKNHGIFIVVVQVIPAATMLMAAAAHVRPSREFLVSGSRHGSAAERAGGHVTRESVADVGRHLLAAIVVSRNDGRHSHVTSPVTLVANCRLLLLV